MGNGVHVGKLRCLWACLAAALMLWIGANRSPAQMLEDELSYDGILPSLREMGDPNDEPLIFVLGSDLPPADLSSTPEPSSAILLAGASAAMLLRRRSRDA